MYCFYDFFDIYVFCCWFIWMLDYVVVGYQ